MAGVYSVDNKMLLIFSRKNNYGTLSGHGKLLPQDHLATLHRLQALAIGNGLGQGTNHLKLGFPPLEGARN